MVSSIKSPAAGGLNFNPWQASAKRQSPEGSKQRTESPATILTLSPQAKALLAGSSAKGVGGVTKTADYYAQFFPTRSGSPASALAQAVADPKTETISKGKSLSEVATAARANMDAKYEAMKASGQPFSRNTFEGKDMNTLMGDLDRRALNAVASNEGGQFSTDEQEMAQTLMSQQMNLAMGMFMGPLRLQDQMPKPKAGDPAVAKAAIDFLDNVSADEKATANWKFQRANSQLAYEQDSKRAGLKPENVDSGDPIVQMLVKASENRLTSMKSGSGYVKDLEDLKRTAVSPGNPLSSGTQGASGQNRSGLLA